VCACSLCRMLNKLTAAGESLWPIFSSENIKWFTLECLNFESQYMILIFVIVWSNLKPFFEKRWQNFNRFLKNYAKIENSCHHLIKCENRLIKFETWKPNILNCSPSVRQGCIRDWYVILARIDVLERALIQNWSVIIQFIVNN